jgi:hypothetical protein
MAIFKSFFNSKKIFFKEGGIAVSLLTEKDKPFACPKPWYGSCPKINTLASLK